MLDVTEYTYINDKFPFLPYKNFNSRECEYGRTFILKKTLFFNNFRLTEWSQKLYRGFPHALKQFSLILTSHGMLKKQNTNRHITPNVNYIGLNTLKYIIHQCQQNHF